MMLLRRWLRRFSYTLSIVAMLFIGCLLVFYWWFPNLAQHKATIEQFLSQEIHQPVIIQNLDTEWEGFRLSLRAQGVRVRGLDDTQSAMRFGELRMVVNPLPLLLGQIRFRTLAIYGLTFELIRTLDGKIKVSDLASSGPAAQGAGLDAIAWWFRQQLVEIKQATLVWRDERDPQRALQFQDIELTLRRKEEQWDFSGGARFPTQLGERLTLNGSLEGMPIGNNNWDGVLNIAFAGLNVAQLPRVLQELLPWKSRGQLDARLSASFVHGQPVGGVGELTVVDFEIPYHREQKPLVAKKLHTEISWHQDGDNWRMLLLHPELELDRTLQVDQLEVDWMGDVYTFRVENVDLAQTVNAVKALQVKLPWQYVLDRVQPAGVVKSARVTVTGKLPKPDDWKFEGDFEGLGWAPYEHFPGLTGVNGKLQLDPRQGRLSVQNGDVELDFPQVLRDLVHFPKLTGNINWNRDDKVWNVQVSDLALANQDIEISNATVAARLPVQRGPSPYIDAHAHVDRLDLASIKRYLPAKIMKAKGVKWADHAFAGGLASNGEFRLRGLVKDFPFQDGKNGEFRLSAEVQDGVLVYDTDWPAISDIRADVEFENQWMRVNAQGGKIMNSRVTKATAVSDELFLKKKPKLLRVDGEVRAKVDDVVQFLTQGPLMKDKDSVPDMAGSGEGLLSLQLDLPIGRLKESSQVAGSYSVEDAGVKFVSNGIGMTQLRGQISFTDRTVYGKALQAQMFDGPVDFDVSSIKPQKPPNIAIDFQGRGNVKGLAPILSDPVVSFLEGEQVPWQGRLEIDRGHAELKVTTQGAGLTSNLPAPLSKSASQHWRINSHAIFEKGTRKIRFNVAERLRGVLAMHRRDGDTQFDRGHITLNGGVPVLPEEPGLQVTVAAATIDVDQWIDAWRRGRENTQDKDKTKRDVNLVEALRSLRLDTQGMHFLGRDLGAMQIEAHSGDSIDWVARLNGPAASGAARVRFDRREEAPHQFKLLLEHLYWPKGLESKTPDDDDRDLPRQYPRLAIDADEFRYGDWHLGRMRLRAQPDAQGWRIESFTADQKALHIKGTGLWHEQVPGLQTELQLQLQSEDSGAALTQLGYANQVAGGKADLRADLRWPGGPSRFRFARLDGEVELEVKKGRFLQVNPGTGRLMGLFNVDALARRLTLDFTDVFSKGLAFDRINAKGRISQGDLFSDGVYIVGPAAMIEAQGRAGLAREDYDMELIIAPDFGGNLTLLSALANPAAGAVMFVLQKLFKKQLAKAVHYRYQVSGPWEDPYVVRVQQTLPETGEEITTEKDQ